MDEVRIGVIGVGLIGKRHIEQYQNIDGAKVVAIADMNEDEAGAVADRFDIRHIYSDFHQLLQRDDVQAVDVCLHNNFHAPVAIAALQAGKHVYCEKPIAGSYTDGAAMVAAARESGRHLHIQLASLYQSETKAAKRIIDGGGLGHIYHARSTGYRRRGRPFVDGYGTASFVKKEVAGGGALYDMGVYHIAQLLYLLGIPAVERISGKVYQEMPMNEERRAQSGYNVEELGLGLVRFGGGLTLDIVEAWAINLDKFEGSSIVGSQGGLRLDPFGYFSTSWDMDMNVSFNLKAEDTRQSRLDPLNGAYSSSQQHWIAALRGQVDLLPTADVALATMLIQEGIYLSDRLGREVTKAEIEEASVSTAASI